MHGWERRQEVSMPRGLFQNHRNIEDGAHGLFLSESSSDEYYTTANKHKQQANEQHKLKQRRKTSQQTNTPTKREPCFTLTDAARSWGWGLVSLQRMHLGCSKWPMVLLSDAPVNKMDTHDTQRINHTYIYVDSLRGSSVKLGTTQIVFAWPLRKDDAHNLRSVNMF